MCDSTHYICMREDATLSVLYRAHEICGCVLGNNNITFSLNTFENYKFLSYLENINAFSLIFMKNPLT